MSSVTWPRAGMTRNGSAYRQPPLVPPISVTASSYLPTPQAANGPYLDVTPIANWETKQKGGLRPSGASIGTSLLWCHEFVTEHLRTGGVLNPEWIEVLMGFPTTWTELPDE